MEMEVVKMLSKKWLALIIIVVASLGTATGYMIVLNSHNSPSAPLLSNNNSTNGNNTSSVGNIIVNTNSTNNTNNSTQNTSSTLISASEARNIAATYIQVSGATAGTPSLVNQDNKMVYVVPVIVNGTNVGEIDIDAQTGANVGGAGGAP
jgi:non-ribosomal peptide synthetase component E (peptide arylation enzyme)